MNFLDLFAGAGGLSEGFLRSGFQPVAHIERDIYACKTLQTRSVYYYLKKNNLLHHYKDYQKTYHFNKKDKELYRTELLDLIPKNELEPIMNMEITEKNIPFIFQHIDERLNYLNNTQIDLIIGGPPCQAYSIVGRARDSNKMEDDPRNYLYKLYVRFLTRYQPKAFIFENVPGILTAFNGALFKNIKAYMKRVGYNIEARKLNAKDFGVLQSRERIIIVGWRKDLEYKYPEIQDNPSDNDYTVKDILYDLPAILSGETYEDIEYAAQSNFLLKQMGIRGDEDIVTHHIARPNTQRDLSIYKLVVEKWNSNSTRIKYNDLPSELITHQNLTSFLDRFKVVAADKKYSHTIVAHISKDGHHYIHPDIEQNRSLTVREAARLQSFPDNYFFEGPRTYNYMQIGNAVPPLMAEKIANWFKDVLELV